MRWLVTEVLPRLAERRADWIYLVVGEGPERQAIAEAATQDPRVAQRVHLLGQTSDDDLCMAYAAADLFVMPNVPVPGDSEGFGIVHLEARAAGLPVVAADIEGNQRISRDGRWSIGSCGRCHGFCGSNRLLVRQRFIPRGTTISQRTHRGAIRLVANYRHLLPYIQ